MSATLLTILNSAAAAIIAFALAMSLGRKDARRDQTVYFAGLLIALLSYVLGQLLIISGAYSLAPHLVGAEITIRMALGPAVFFYTRALISSTPTRIAGRDWLALVGPALVIATSMPFLLLSADEKLALANPSTRDPVHFQYALFACTAGVVLFLGFTAYYIVGALKLQARHRTRMMQQFSNIEQQSLDWLRKVLLLFSVAWFFLGAKQIMWISGISAPAFYLSLASIETLAIACFAYFGLRQPALSYDRSEADPVARAPILTEAHMARLADKLASALNADRLYAESTLSLRDLSDATGATKNHISETLSQYLEVNFFDFVNKRRIEEAERLLCETDETVLGIGLDVGFNSRSTFNAAFLKHAGLTPSAFRATKGPSLQSTTKSEPGVYE